VPGILNFFVYNVGNWGGLTKVEIQSSGSTTWYPMTQPGGDNGWVLQVPSALSQYTAPLSVRITDTDGNVITETGLIKSFGLVNYSFSNPSQYALPAGFSAEQTNPPDDSVVKIGVPVIVGSVVLLILIVALFLVLRSKARQHNQSVTEYVRRSIAPSTLPKREEVSLKDAPTTPRSPVTEQPTEQSPGIDLTVVTNQTATTPQGGWEKRTDLTTGQEYYYNASNGASQWEAPDGYQA